jgi:SAM-dependent methyltransferase
MQQVPFGLAGHPDRLSWNARYQSGFGGSFTPHPIVVRALSMPIPDGPVLELASGPSGSALLVAAAGRRVTAVDASDVALAMLGEEARRRDLGDAVTLVNADLGSWHPDPGSYSLVLCTGYWDRAVFSRAADAVSPGGLLGWEAYTTDVQRVRPGFPADWCLAPGEPASLLPAGFTVLGQDELTDNERGARRHLLARRGSDAASGIPIRSR